MIASRFRELVDALLRHLVPVADGDLLANTTTKSPDVVDRDHVDVLTAKAAKSLFRPAFSAVAFRPPRHCRCRTRGLRRRAARAGLPAPSNRQTARGIV